MRDGKPATNTPFECTTAMDFNHLLTSIVLGLGLGILFIKIFIPSPQDKQLIISYFGREKVLMNKPFEAVSQRRLLVTVIDLLTNTILVERGAIAHLD